MYEDFWLDDRDRFDEFYEDNPHDIALIAVRKMVEYMEEDGISEQEAVRAIYRLDKDFKGWNLEAEMYECVQDLVQETSLRNDDEAEEKAMGRIQEAVKDEYGHLL